MKTAISVDEQIKKLRTRGMIIDTEQESKAKEALLDISYYRLGCYWFPFENTPAKRERSNSHVQKRNHF